MKATSVVSSYSTVLGIPPLPGVFSALNEASLTPEQKLAAFPIWVSTYFTPAVVMPEDDYESSGFIDMVLTRKPVHETARAGSEFAGPRWTPTVHRMPLAEVAEPDTMARSQMLIQRVDRSVYAENSRRALFDCYVSSSDHEQMIWPRVDVHVVWCDMTFGDVVYSAHKLERANHMLPWEKPDRFTAFIARIA